jgi:hypothetical protein
MKNKNNKNAFLLASVALLLTLCLSAVGCSALEPCSTFNDGIPSTSFGDAVCCAASCGTCGGPGCGQRPGGAFKCCDTAIINSNVLCSCGANRQLAPCIQQDPPVTPTPVCNDEDKVWKPVGGNITIPFNPATTPIYQYYGSATTISPDGSTLVVGGTNYGFFVAYERARDGTWQQLGQMVFNNLWYSSAIALSQNGRRLIIGSFATREVVNGTSTQTGAAFIYDYSCASGRWELFQRILGDTGLSRSSRFGLDVDMSHDGTVVVIGAPEYTDTTSCGTLCGQVKMFEQRAGSTEFVQLGESVYGQEFSQFGYSVALAGEAGRVFIVGAPFHEFAPGVGRWSGISAVYRYDDRLQSVLLLDTIHGSNTDSRAGFSVAISADGKYVVIGSHLLSGPVRVYFYRCPTFQYQQRGQDLTVQEPFGASVAISDDGNTIAVGQDLPEVCTDNDTAAARVYHFNTTTYQWVQRDGDIVRDIAPRCNPGDGFNPPLAGLQVSLTSAGDMLATHNVYTAGNVARVDSLQCPD